MLAPCTCTKLPHTHYNGREGYTVVTRHKVIEVASYEAGRALMQTIFGLAVLYYHCKPIKGIVSDRGNLMYISNNEYKLPNPRTKWDWYTLTQDYPPPNAPNENPQKTNLLIPTFITDSLLHRFIT